MKKQAFYVCFYENPAAGHSVSLRDDFPERPSKPHEGVGTPFYFGKLQFAKIVFEYVELMLGFVEFIPLVVGTSAEFANTLLYQTLRTFAHKKANSVTALKDRTIYSIPIELMQDFRRMGQTVSSSMSTARRIPPTLLVSLTSSYELLVSSLLNQIAEIHPEAFVNADRTISISEILSYKDHQELRSAIIGKEIDSVMRESCEVQIEQLCKKMKHDHPKKDFEKWSEFLELFYRRNLVVHTNGVVNSTYLKAAEINNFADRDKIVTNAKLNVGMRYLGAAAIILTEFGLKLSHVIWRKLLKDQSDEADGILAELCFDFIVRGHYELAIGLLKFGVNLRGITDLRRRMMIINLANALKLSGKEEDSSKILMAEDWSASNAQFEICLAAVRGDIDTVATLMKDKRSGLAPEDYEQWPVFFHVREDHKFLREFRKTFRREFVGGPQGKASVRHLVEGLISPSKDSTETLNTDPLKNLTN